MAFARFRPVLWPRSLQGQVLLAIALALLIAQTISAVLIWREQSHRRESGMVSTAAFKLLGPPHREHRARRNRDDDTPPPFKMETSDVSPRLPHEKRLPRVEHELAEVLASQSFDAAEVVVFERHPMQDPDSVRFMRRHQRELAVFSN
ncbi:MAG: hypothetical protein RIS85_2728, partial [Pseudomonadota bacterium]